jgi:hypothetical protein
MRVSPPNSVGISWHPLDIRGAITGANGVFELDNDIYALFRKMRFVPAAIGFDAETSTDFYRLSLYRALPRCSSNRTLKASGPRSASARGPDAGTIRA